MFDEDLDIEYDQFESEKAILDDVQDQLLARGKAFMRLFNKKGKHENRPTDWPFLINVQMDNSVETCVVEVYGGEAMIHMKLYGRKSECKRFNLAIPTVWDEMTDHMDKVTK